MPPAGDWVREAHNPIIQGPGSAPLLWDQEPARASPLSLSFFSDTYGLSSGFLQLLGELDDMSYGKSL